MSPVIDRWMAALSNRQRQPCLMARHHPVAANHEVANLAWCMSAAVGIRSKLWLVVSTHPKDIQYHISQGENMRCLKPPRATEWKCWKPMNWDEFGPLPMPVNHELSLSWSPSHMKRSSSITQTDINPALHSCSQNPNGTMAMACWITVPNLVAFRHKKKQRFGTSNSRRLQDLGRQAARQIEDVVLALATAALAISTGAAAAAPMKCWVFYRFSTGFLHSQTIHDRFGRFVNQFLRLQTETARAASADSATVAVLVRLEVLVPLHASPSWEVWWVIIQGIESMVSTFPTGGWTPYHWVKSWFLANPCLLTQRLKRCGPKSPRWPSWLRLPTWRDMRKLQLSSWAANEGPVPKPEAASGGSKNCGTNGPQNSVSQCQPFLCNTSYRATDMNRLWVKES